MSLDCTVPVGTSMSPWIFYLPPGIIIVELVLVDGVEGCRGEDCSDLSDKHLTMVAGLLHVNMERNELEKTPTYFLVTSRWIDRFATTCFSLEPLVPSNPMWHFFGQNRH